MADTVRSIDDLLNLLFAANQPARSITEQDIRDAIVSISWETADLSGLARSPAGLNVGRLWIDDTNALRLVTVFQTALTISSQPLPAAGQIMADARIPAQGSLLPVSSSMAGAGALTASASVVPANIKFGDARISGAGSVSAARGYLRMIGRRSAGGAGAISGAARQRMRVGGSVGGAGAIGANASVSGSATVWSGTGPNNTLSPGNLTVTHTGANDIYVYESTVANKFKSSGKWYWEIKIGTKVFDTSVGIGNPATSLSGFDASYGSWLGCDTNSYGVFAWGGGSTSYDTYNNTVINGTLPFITGNDVMSIALDCDNWKFWIRENGGLWNLGMSGAQDPGTNQGGIAIPAGMRTGGVGPAIDLQGLGDWITAYFAQGSWQFQAPANFLAL